MDEWQPIETAPEPWMRGFLPKVGDHLITAHTLDDGRIVLIWDVTRWREIDRPPKDRAPGVAPQSKCPTQCPSSRSGSETLRARLDKIGRRSVMDTADQRLRIEREVREYVHRIYDMGAIGATGSLMLELHMEVLGWALDLATVPATVLQEHDG